ncbi:uncharacterized protein [Triticum aestivum]|uniref:uncharacterized protein isoform X2 n=1 Tax=Triticum aestivum TaxID=4565 RepID=UPI001D00C7FC|nr:uncharacterized protein LOC123166516 isoform X2 [Triticum aestivum]
MDQGFVQAITMVRRGAAGVKEDVSSSCLDYSRHDLIRYKGFVMPGSSFLLLPCNGGGSCVFRHRLQKQPWHKNKLIRTE